MISAGGMKSYSVRSYGTAASKSAAAPAGAAAPETTPSSGGVYGTIGKMADEASRAGNQIQDILASLTGIDGGGAGDGGGAIGGLM